MLAALALAFQVAATPPYQFVEDCVVGRSTACEISQVAPVNIADVNFIVNHAIKPKPDKLGEMERWRAFPADRSGDCTEKAMTKRAYLIALGMDPSKLTIVTGEHFRDGEWRAHMLLEVQLSDRVWVLDNMTDKPYQPASPDRLPWREHSRVSTGLGHPVG